MDAERRRLGAKKGAETMLFYYLESLIGTVDDPKQVVATELGTSINFSEAQIQYVKMNVMNDNKMLDNLSCSIDLLKNMEQTGKIDLDSIGIIRNILEIMHGQCEQTIKEYDNSVETDESI